MPPAKRVKSSADSRPAAGPSGRPTVDDLEGESEFATLARQHWLKTPKSTAAKAKVKVKNDVLKREIWDTLEKENFPLKSLLVLEGLQTLERSVSSKDGLSLMLSEFMADRLSFLQLLMAWLWGELVQLPCPPHCSPRQC
jgi:hypothetical protein